MHTTHTLQDTLLGDRSVSDEHGPPIPGLVLIWTQGRPACLVFPVTDHGLVLGRDAMTGSGLPVDPAMSRKHVEIRLVDEEFAVYDLSSRNGTFVDGSQVCGRAQGTSLRVLRAGASLFLLCRDVRAFRSRGITRMDKLIMGPKLIMAWRTIAHLARAGSNLFLHGETGTGKERAVEAFHALGGRSARPLIAVNCGAIPAGMAERLLFGTKRGAYSGAMSDADGYVQAASGGVLFLDEVAELEHGVQTKLLRAVETGEVTPLGENQPRKIDFLLCAATHKDLRSEVESGRFRQDLYFRLARPEVRLPPLRERIEEIPWLIDMAATEHGLAVHHSIVEACLQRPWPGNIRELLVEIRSAIHLALVEESTVLKEMHLARAAGMRISEEAKTGHGVPPRAMTDRSKPVHRSAPDRDTLEVALREHRGNVAAAARALGIHRTQLRRWLARFGIDTSKFTETSQASAAD